MTLDDIAPQLQRRRDVLAGLWGPLDAVVLVGAGEPIHIPGRADLTYEFRAHSEYFYLTDRERPGGVIAFDPDAGWADFVVPISTAERLWEGGPELEDPGTPIDALTGWLERRRGRPLALLGTPLPGLSADAERTQAARLALNAVRRRKDPVELARMRAAMRATEAGFAAARALLEPGRSEREIQIELETEFLRHGADRPGYHTIVGSGTNSAVLHFAPSGRQCAEGELVLIDAGAEVRGYVSDVTRTYVVGKQPSGEQRALLETVATALHRAVSLCRAGTEYREAHRAAALVIGAGLLDAGILRGTPEDLLARGAVSLFFPHGIGHMVGLGVRDAGELLPGRELDRTLYPGLRIDLPLETGHVVTIEPGLYFVPALLGDPDARERLRDAVHWERVDAMLGFGGIRLEHNVLVTDGEPEVLSAAIP